MLALRKLQRGANPKSPLLFTTERGSPLSALVWRLSYAFRLILACCATPVVLR
jgi:hypothetical protein